MHITGMYLADVYVVLAYGQGLYAVTVCKCLVIYVIRVCAQCSYARLG